MEFNIYKDIKERTGGEIYIGVVGPVRTGKSTFIKSFMDIMVMPKIGDVNEAKRTRDELPQSAGGKTIMTTEPKFIPKTATNVNISNDTDVKIRLIDCVGYMVKGAEGVMEDGEERKVKTPWFDYEIPFSKAAEIGTKKVISEHSTIGIVITTDGSFGDIAREEYVPAEEKTIKELKQLNKPFIVVINSENPMSKKCQEIRSEIEKRYGVSALALNCLQMNEKDIKNILERILFEFPVVEIEMNTPGWIDILDDEHPIKQYIMEISGEILDRLISIKDVENVRMIQPEGYINNIELKSINLSSGVVKIYYEIDESFYYQVLTELTGNEINNEYELIRLVKELSSMKTNYEKVNNAIDSVKQKGYGIVTPSREEITLENPELIKNGSKYGVKIKATAPSLHFIKANIMTEIAPIIGTEEQANDLINFLKNSDESDEGIWDTNIFGKSIEQIVDDGIETKIARLTEETQTRVQNTVEKITNEQNRGVICILL